MPLLGGRSAISSDNMTSNSRNVKLSFLTTRCHYWGLDLPVDLPLHLPIRALTVEMWNCHSWPLDASTKGVDVPVDLPIWVLTGKIWNCHSYPLADLLGGRSANFEHTLCFMLCFTDGPFIYMKDQIRCIQSTINASINWLGLNCSPLQLFIKYTS